MNLQKLYFNWSSGKDSALALYYLMQNKQYSIEKLLTSMNSHYNRISMHGVHRKVYNAQVKSIGIPAMTIELPENTDMELYEQKLSEVIQTLKEENFTHCGFGDIFLQDLRNYREKQLQPFNITPVFPLWGRETRELVYKFLELGFKTIIVSAMDSHLNSDFVGQIIDKSLINALPKHVDPCGENGEFHTFCFDGPIFQYPIDIKTGEKIHKTYTTQNDGNSDKKTGVWYCDILLNKET